MIYFFLFFVQSQNLYDLIEPFRWSPPYQMNNWGVYGVTNLRESLKFDQKNLQNLSAICNLIPHNNSDFDVIIQTYISSGSLNFIYSNEDCPVSYFYNMDDYSFSDGFLLRFSKVNSNSTEVHIIFNNQSSIDYSKPIKIGDFYENLDGGEENNVKPNMISFQLKKTSNQLSINYFNSKSKSEKWENVKKFDIKLINTGYFSFFGTPSSTGSGDQILYSFIMKEPSKPEPTYFNQNETIHKNFKIFKSKLGIYYKKKENLYYSSKVSVNETLTNSRNQTAIDEETTKLIFHILSEITERAKLGLNDTEFETLLELSAVMKLMRSERKITKRRAALEEIGSYINNIKLAVIENLTNFTKNISDEMRNIEEEGFEALKKFMPMLWKGNNVVNEAIKMKKESKKEFPVNLVLLLISAVETVLFVTFFIIKRHKTKDFRKID